MKVWPLVSRTLAVMVTGVLAVTSMTAHAQGSAQRGGTLVMVVQPEPPTLAAYQSTAGPVGQVSTKVFEGLLEYSFELKPIPSLAQSWAVSPDGMTVTFKLLPAVKFHDGKPFTSEDVKFTVMEVLNSDLVSTHGGKRPRHC